MKSHDKKYLKSMLESSPIEFSPSDYQLNVFANIIENIQSVYKIKEMEAINLFKNLLISYYVAESKWLLIFLDECLKRRNSDALDILHYIFSTSFYSKQFEQVCSNIKKENPFFNNMQIFKSAMIELN
tara:strand:+ start:3036 stop:3419 length:384 start_codon:yes stop_codon:yes gene_type:complete